MAARKPARKRVAKKAPVRAWEPKPSDLSDAPDELFLIFRGSGTGPREFVTQRFDANGRLKAEVRRPWVRAKGREWLNPRSVSESREVAKQMAAEFGLRPGDFILILSSPDLYGNDRFLRNFMVTRSHEVRLVPGILTRYGQARV